LAVSLVAYWKLGETSGNRADSVGANTLTDTNTVTYDTGIIGNAAKFTAANSEHLTIADNAAVSTGDVDFTIACWLKLADPDTGANEYMFGKGSSSGAENTFEYWLRYVESSSKMQFSVGNNVTVLANTFGVVTLGTWIFVVCWHDATANTLNIQINNGAADSAADTGIQAENTNALSFGRPGEYDGVYYGGLIDEVGFWKRVLTGEEKTYLYNLGVGHTYPFTS
jgi:hypothetical protein